MDDIFPGELDSEPLKRAVMNLSPSDVANTERLRTRMQRWSNFQLVAESLAIQAAMAEVGTEGVLLVRDKRGELHRVQKE